MTAALPATLPERLLALARRAPNREALRLVTPNLPDEVLSRADLFHVAASAAGILASAGVSAGDLVIIVQQNSLLLAASFFGAALLGAIPSILPFQTEKLHPDRYRAAMSALVGGAQPAALATEPDLAAGVTALLPDGPGLPVVIPFQADDVQGEGFPLTLARAYDPADTALLQHSSGTTGLQKGVALSHRAIFEQIDRYGRALGFSEDDAVASWLPLYHDMGLIAGFLLPLLTGARLALLSPLEWVRAPHLLLHTIHAQQSTFCWLPNFAYNFLAQKTRPADLDGVRLDSVRAFVNCSEPIYASSHALFLERFGRHGVGAAQLATSYAMAEAVFAVTQSPIGQPAPVERVSRVRLDRDSVAQPVGEGVATDGPVQTVVSSGQPIEGMAVRVLDSARADLAERHVGEIAIRSSHLLTGYHRRPDATAEAFHDGWYLTGDMGYLADGELFVLGRKKDLIIVGGRNIYPRDIETLVNQVDGVHPGRAVAFGIPNPQRGTEDVAVVAELACDGDGGQQAAIAADIRRAVAGGTDIMLRYVELVPRGWLVKTSSGKVARAANRARFLDMHPEIEQV